MGKFVDLCVYLWKFQETFHQVEKGNILLYRDVRFNSHLDGQNRFKASWEDKVEFRTFVIFDGCSGDTCEQREELISFWADWGKSIAFYIVVAGC